MADYSTIKGFNVETLSSDPYASVAASGTWASGGDVNTGKLGMIGFGATQNAVLKSVGEGGSPSGVTNKTELYDGTSWTEVADGSQACQGGAGFGTTAAGINATGSTSSVTQTWDGTSWADGNNVNTQVTSAAGIGITTAGIKASGVTPSPAATVDTETYNGTTWTESPDVNQATYQLMGAGTTTAAIIGGGVQLPNTNYDTTETYDGTAWTAVTPMGTGRAGFGCGTSGTQSDWLVFGGGPDTPAYTANTEHWNGSAWTEVANLATAMANGASGGISTSALSVMGRGPGSIPFGVDTEEFTAASPVTIAQEGQVWYNDASDVLKGFGQQGTGAWASGGTVPGYYYGGSLGGTQTAAVVAGGNPGQTTLSFEYNGTSWSATNPLNQGRMYTVCAGFGPQTASQVAGGETTVYLNNSEQYDGTSWAAVNPMLNSLQSRSIGGTQAGAIAISGHPGPTTAVEDWDGTCFSAGTASPQARGYGMGGGTQTSAISCGGTSGIATADVWNGSAWTEIADMNSGRHNSGRAITSDSNALIFAGEPEPAGRGVLTEQWNGSAWTELADLATAGNKRPGCGTPLLAMCAGNEAPNNGITEEWTVPTATKTFTAS